MSEIKFEKKSEKKILGDRIEEFRSWKRMEKKEFSELLDFKTTTSYSSVINGNKNLTFEKLVQLKNKFPDINLNWLITGQGEMLLTDTADPKNIAVMEERIAYMEKQIIKTEGEKEAFRAAHETLAKSILEKGKGID